MAADSTGDKLALGSAITGGAIAAALIETLFDKGALTLEESRTVLDRAPRNISFHHRARERRPEPVVSVETKSAKNTSGIPSRSVIVSNQSDWTEFQPGRPSH